MNRCFFYQLSVENFATAHVTKLQLQFIHVHDQDIFGLDVAVGYVVLLQLTETFEEKLEDILDLFLRDNLFFFLCVLDEVVEVHFSTLHHNKSHFFPIVLIQFEFS